MSPPTGSAGLASHDATAKPSVSDSTVSPRITTSRPDTRRISEVDTSSAGAMRPGLDTSLRSPDALPRFGELRSGICGPVLSARITPEPCPSAARNAADISSAEAKRPSGDLASARSSSWSASGGTSSCGAAWLGGTTGEFRC